MFEAKSKGLEPARSSSSPFWSSPAIIMPHPHPCQSLSQTSALDFPRNPAPFGTVDLMPIITLKLGPQVSGQSPIRKVDWEHLDRWESATLVVHASLGQIIWY
jgi:hypothetical protein